MRKIILIPLVIGAGLLMSPAFGQSISRILARASNISTSPASTHSATIDSTATVDPGATVNPGATVDATATAAGGATQDAGATVETPGGFNIWSPAPLPPPKTYPTSRTAIQPYKLKH